jgi:hypothetical protein
MRWRGRAKDVISSRRRSRGSSRRGIRVGGRSGSGSKSGRRSRDRSKSGSRRRVYPWQMPSIKMLPAGALNEVHITPVVDSSGNEHPVAGWVVRMITQQNTLLRSRLEMPLLQFHRSVDNDLAAPHSEMSDAWLHSSKQLPRHLGRTPGLHEVVDVHCRHQSIRPELKVKP